MVNSDIFSLGKHTSEKKISNSPMYTSRYINENPDKNPLHNSEKG